MIRNNILLFVTITLLFLWLFHLIKNIIVNKKIIKNILKKEILVLLFFLIIIFILFWKINVFSSAGELWTHTMQADCVYSLGQDSFCNYNIFGSDHELVLPLFFGMMLKLFGKSIFIIKFFFASVLFLLLSLSYFIFRSQKTNKIISIIGSLPILIIARDFSSFIFSLLFIYLLILYYINKKNFKFNYRLFYLTIFVIIYSRVEFIFFIFPIVFYDLIRNYIIYKKSINNIIKKNFVFILLLLFYFIFFIILVKFRTNSLSSSINYLAFLPFSILIYFICKILKLDLKKSLFFSILSSIFLIILYFFNNKFLLEYNLLNIIFFKIPLWIKRFFSISTLPILIIFIFYFIFNLKYKNYSIQNIFLISWISLFYSYMVLEHNFVDMRFLLGIVVIYTTLFALSNIPEKRNILFFIYLLSIILLFGSFVHLFIGISHDQTCDEGKLNFIKYYNSSEKYLFPGINTYELFSFYNVKILEESDCFNSLKLKNKDLNIYRKDFILINYKKNNCDSSCYNQSFNIIKNNNFTIDLINSTDFFDFYRVYVNK